MGVSFREDPAGRATDFKSSQKSPNLLYERLFRICKNWLPPQIFVGEPTDSPEKRHSKTPSTAIEIPKKFEIFRPIVRRVPGVLSKPTRSQICSASISLKLAIEKLSLSKLLV